MFEFIGIVFITVIVAIATYEITDSKRFDKKCKASEFIYSLTLDDFEFSKEISNLLISKKNVKRIFCVNSDKEKACILEYLPEITYFQLKRLKKKRMLF